MTAPPLVGCVVWSPTPILFINTPEEGACYEEEVQPYRKTDYKPIIYYMGDTLDGDATARIRMDG